MLEKIKIDIVIDRSKILDEAVFMAIEALHKCRNNNGIIAEERLKRAIKGLTIVYDDIEQLTDRHMFPSKHYLMERNYI